MSERSSVPSYRQHKQSGQAIVTLPDGFGGRRDVLLGEYGTAASRCEYARVIAEWEAHGRRLPQSPTAAEMTINELILAFWHHVEQNYLKPDGSPTLELANVKFALRTLRQIYGPTQARSFGPKALKTVQHRMVELGLCRNTINRRVGRIKSMFRWAESEEMVPPSTLHSLETVRGLAKGRSQARETEPVRPVHPEMVERTLPFLLPTVADMVRLQLLTGMRPGELVIMRGIDIDMTGKIWLYRPGSNSGAHGMHKTAHHGHHRVVPIGPRGQEIVRRYLKPNVEAYLFTPQHAMASFRAELRSRRKSKVQPSQQNRRKSRLKRQPGDRYTVGTYRNSIRRACLRSGTYLCVGLDANGNGIEITVGTLQARSAQYARFFIGWLVRAADDEIVIACRRSFQEQRIPLSLHCVVARERKICRLTDFSIAVPCWHPHQLRHTKATEIRREAGLDAARAVLGHRSPQITETYAEIDINKAAEVMAKLG
jgi:integrase